jgi:purine-nucleoside phosphorylase
MWKKTNKAYNFDVLPKTAILTLSNNVLSRKNRVLYKKTKGIAGLNYIINKNVLLCSSFGSGASAIISLLEELRILGVENFIFIGLAGKLVSSTDDTFIVENSFSTCGSTLFYSKNEEYKPVQNSWFTGLKGKLNLKTTVCWSTDAPFRETKSLLSHFKEKNATHVDMECAAIYAFSEFYNSNAICIIVSADSFIDNVWLPPKSNIVLNENLNQLVKMIITLAKH